MTNIEKFKSITDNMFELYKMKNANYGNSFTHAFEELGEVAALYPLMIKFDRLKSLVSGQTNNFESIEDTLTDLANYAIMYRIELENKKEKEN